MSDQLAHVDTLCSFLQSWTSEWSAMRGSETPPVSSSPRESWLKPKPQVNPLISQAAADDLTLIIKNATLPVGLAGIDYLRGTDWIDDAELSFLLTTVDWDGRHPQMTMPRLKWRNKINRKIAAKVNNG